MTRTLIRITILFLLLAAFHALQLFDPRPGQQAGMPADAALVALEKPELPVASL